MQQTPLPRSLNVKKTRKAEFLEQRERVVPWAELVALIAPYHPEGENGRQFFAGALASSIPYLELPTPATRSRHHLLI